jgi:2-haloacid dehalogenase
MNRREFVTGTLTLGATSAVAPVALRSAVAAQAATAAAQAATLSTGAPAHVLVFDTFGTVVDWRGSVIAEGQRLGKAKGLAQVDWAAFADAWRAGYGPSMNRVRRGELPWTKLDVLHRMVLDELLVRFKIGDLSEAEKAHLNLVWHRLDPWPDAVEGLTRIKAKFVIAPLSNGNLSLLTEMAKHAKLPWDAILSTEIVRHYKPDKETYLMPVEFFDLEPAGVMMVAAHEGDLDAAKALGLKTAYVHRPFEYGPGKESRRPASGKFDFYANDFKELAGLLGA